MIKVNVGKIIIFFMFITKEENDFQNYLEKVSKNKKFFILDWPSYE